MAYNRFAGTFTGFAFGDVHSSQLGIARVSSSNRYDDNFLPTIKDTTVDVVGADGTYFFNSKYTQKQFTINYAFDHMTLEQYRKMTQTFGSKTPQNLTFDDAPYKHYVAKVTGNANVKTLCFDEKDETDNKEKRIYKGEGTIQFTCYKPFAYSNFQTLEEFETWKGDEDDKDIWDWKAIIYDAQDQYEDRGNLLDWRDGGFLSEDISYTEGTEIKYYNKYNYNAGDMPAPFIYYFDAIGKSPSIAGYVLTTDTVIIANKNYYIKVDEDNYTWVEEPSIDHINEYYNAYYTSLDNGTVSTLEITNNSALPLGSITLEKIDKIYLYGGYDTPFGVRFKYDSKVHLLTLEYYRDTTIYRTEIVNYAIKAGSFFKIPKGVPFQVYLRGNQQSELSNKLFYDTIYY